MLLLQVYVRRVTKTLLQWSQFLQVMSTLECSCGKGLSRGQVLALSFHAFCNKQFSESCTDFTSPHVSWESFKSFSKAGPQTLWLGLYLNEDISKVHLKVTMYKATWLLKSFFKNLWECEVWFAVPRDLFR